MNVAHKPITRPRKKGPSHTHRQHHIFLNLHLTAITVVSRLSRDDFHPSYSLYKSKACDWLITGIRKEFTSKNTKEKISCGVGRTEEISHQRRMGWCEICTCMVGCAKFAHAWAVVQNSHLLGLLSSEGHIFLILAPNRTRFEELDSWFPGL